MSFESRLSKSLQVYIEAQDSNPELWGLSAEELGLAEAIAQEVVQSREGITGNKFSSIESLLGHKHPGSIEYCLDDHFTREVIYAVRGYVDRTMRLSRLEAVKIPSDVTSIFLHEATRTYILGLPQASVALSRAALEQALKENIGYQSTGTFVKIKDLLDEAEQAQVLDKVTRQVADRIVKVANDVLHERATDLTEAFDVLVLLRGLLQHLYSG